jgi:hypothetical protein
LAGVIVDKANQRLVFSLGSFGLKGEMAMHQELMMTKPD